MYASLMAGLKALEKESPRLKKMYALEQLKPESLQEAMARNSEAISAR